MSFTVCLWEIFLRFVERNTGLWSKIVLVRECGMEQLTVVFITLSDTIKKSSLDRFCSPSADGMKVYSLRVG